MSLAEAALEELRSRGHLAASKKVWLDVFTVRRHTVFMRATLLQAARVAAEGLVGVASSAHAAVLVELNCETDFVARNPKFQASTARCIPRSEKASHSANAGVAQCCGSLRSEA